MQKPLSDEYNSFYQRYIDWVPEGDFLTLLHQNTADTVRFFETIAAEKHDYRYAEGKWTLKEVLMHLIDTERVFAYRALVGARADSSTILPYMEEDEYARNADVSLRTVQSLIAEFKAVRGATLSLFEHMSDAQSQFKANTTTVPITPRAIGYISIGHILHHIGVIEERYL